MDISTRKQVSRQGTPTGSGRNLVPLYSHWDPLGGHVAFGTEALSKLTADFRMR